MKFTFSTPNWESAERCEKPRTFTVEADTEDEARERAMHERWGPPRGVFSSLGRWTGQGLIREDVAD